MANHLIQAAKSRTQIQLKHQSLGQQRLDDAKESGVAAHGHSAGAISNRGLPGGSKQVLVKLPSAAAAQASAGRVASYVRIPNLDGNLTDEDSDEEEQRGGETGQPDPAAVKAKSTVVGSFLNLDQQQKQNETAATSSASASTPPPNRSKQKAMSHSIKSLLGVSDDEDEDVTKQGEEAAVVHSSCPELEATPATSLTSKSASANASTVGGTSTALAELESCEKPETKSAAASDSVTSDHQTMRATAPESGLDDKPAVQSEPLTVNECIVENAVSVNKDSNVSESVEESSEVKSASLGQDVDGETEEGFGNTDNKVGEKEESTEKEASPDPPKQSPSPVETTPSLEKPPSLEEEVTDSKEESSGIVDGTAKATSEEPTANPELSQENSVEESSSASSNPEQTSSPLTVIPSSFDQDSATISKEATDGKVLDESKKLESDLTPETTVLDPVEKSTTALSDLKEPSSSTSPPPPPTVTPQPEPSLTSTKPPTTTSTSSSATCLQICDITKKKEDHPSPLSERETDSAAKEPPSLAGAAAPAAESAAEPTPVAATVGAEETSLAPERPEPSPSPPTACSLSQSGPAMSEESPKPPTATEPAGEPVGGSPEPPLTDAGQLSTPASASATAPSHDQSAASPEEALVSESIGEKDTTSVTATAVPPPVCMATEEPSVAAPATTPPASPPSTTDATAPSSPPSATSLPTCADTEAEAAPSSTEPPQEGKKSPNETKEVETEDQSSTLLTSKEVQVAEPDQTSQDSPSEVEDRVESPVEEEGEQPDVQGELPRPSPPVSLSAKAPPATSSPAPAAGEKGPVGDWSDLHPDAPPPPPEPKKEEIEAPLEESGSETPSVPAEPLDAVPSAVVKAAGDVAALPPSEEKETSEPASISHTLTKEEEEPSLPIDQESNCDTKHGDLTTDIPVEHEGAEKQTPSEKQEELSESHALESHKTEVAEAEGSGHVKELSVLNTEPTKLEASSQEALPDLSHRSSPVLDVPPVEIDEFLEKQSSSASNDVESDGEGKTLESPFVPSSVADMTQEKSEVSVSLVATVEQSSVTSNSTMEKQKQSEPVEEKPKDSLVAASENLMTSDATLVEKEQNDETGEKPEASLVATIESSTASKSTLDEKNQEKPEATFVATSESLMTSNTSQVVEVEDRADTEEDEADVSQSALEGNDPASSSLAEQADDQVHGGSEEDFLSSIIGDGSYAAANTEGETVAMPSSSDLVDAFSLVTAAENEEVSMQQTDDAVQAVSSAVPSVPELPGQSLCNICDKTFASYQEMLLHRRRHKVTETLECPYCKREYTDRNRYEIHIRWHTGEKPFSCPICGKGFREKRKLKLHIRRHNSDLGHKCSLCPRSFEGKRSLAKHMLAHKNNTTVTPKVVKKTDGSVALAMPPDPSQKKSVSTTLGEEAIVLAPVVQPEQTLLVNSVQPKQVVEEQQAVDLLEPPQLTVVVPTPAPIEVSSAPVLEPASILVSTPVAPPTIAPITFSVPVNEPPPPPAAAAAPLAVEIVRTAGLTNMGPPAPPPAVSSQDTLSFSVDDLMQYATPDLSSARPASLIHEHHADLEERLTETATTTLPVGMDEFASERLNSGGQVASSSLNDSGEYPDLLDSDSNIAVLDYEKGGQGKSHDLPANDESGLTFATLSGVSPEYPEGKKEEKEQKPQRPFVVARKSVAPDPQESIGKSKTEEIMTALASEAAAQLAKANITLPAGTCLVPASSTSGDPRGGSEKKSLQVLPAVLTSGNVTNSFGADISLPNKPMTITIQYKIYSGEQGQPQTVAVKKSLTDLINEAPGGPRQFDSSSAASSASSTPIPPVLTAIKTRVPSLPSPSPSPEVPTSQTPAVVVAKAPATPASEISTSTVPPIEVGQTGPDPLKETRTEVTPAGNKYEVPTIVTSGYDLDALLCTMCNRTFKNDKTLMGHMLGHFGVAPKMAHCPLCGLTLQKKSYARHLRLHGDVVPEICPYCQKGFRERRSLDKHIKAVHHSERPFACEYCPERFITEEERLAHHQNHQALQKGYIYQCQVCDVTFLKQEDLDVHSKVHRVDGKLFICEVCGKNFSNEQNKRIHVLRHQGSWPHRCDVCCLTFQLKKQLQKHSASHTRSTQVVTAKINTFLESFTASLESDMLGLNDPSGSADISSGNDQAIAAAVMKMPDENSLEDAAAEAALMFGQSELTEELLEDEASEDLSVFSELEIPELKPGQLLQCPNCDDKMGSKRAYLLHLKRHATQLNYKCKYCPKTFVGKANLDIHYFKVHGEGQASAGKPQSVDLKGDSTSMREKAVSVQTTKCALCPKTFTDNESLQAHVQIHFRGNASERKIDKKLWRQRIISKKRPRRYRYLAKTRRFAPVMWHGYTFKCKVCEISLPSKCSRAVHKILCHNRRSWRCNFCNDLYRTLSGLKSHLFNFHKTDKEELKMLGILRHANIFAIVKKPYRTLTPPPTPPPLQPLQSAMRAPSTSELPLPKQITKRSDTLQDVLDIADSMLMTSDSGSTSVSRCSTSLSDMGSINLSEQGLDHPEGGRDDDPATAEAIQKQKDKLIAMMARKIKTRSRSKDEDKKTKKTKRDKVKKKEKRGVLDSEAGSQNTDGESNRSKTSSPAQLSDAQEELPKLSVEDVKDNIGDGAPAKQNVAIVHQDDEETPQMVDVLKANETTASEEKKVEKPIEKAVSEPVEKAVEESPEKTTVEAKEADVMPTEEKVQESTNDVVNDKPKEPNSTKSIFDLDQPTTVEITKSSTQTKEREPTKVTRLVSPPPAEQKTSAKPKLAHPLAPRDLKLEMAVSSIMPDSNDDLGDIFGLDFAADSNDQGQKEPEKPVESEPLKKSDDLVSKDKTDLTDASAPLLLADSKLETFPPKEIKRKEIPRHNTRNPNAMRDYVTSMLSSESSSSSSSSDDDDDDDDDSSDDDEDEEEDKEEKEVDTSTESKVSEKSDATTPEKKPLNTRRKNMQPKVVLQDLKDIPEANPSLKSGRTRQRSKLSEDEESESKPKEEETPKESPKKKGDDEQVSKVEEKQAETTVTRSNKRKGRPRKRVSKDEATHGREEDSSVEPVQVQQESEVPAKTVSKRKRGRPRKNIAAFGQQEPESTETTDEPKDLQPEAPPNPAKETGGRKRGRPRKISRAPETPNDESESTDADSNAIGTRTRSSRSVQEGSEVSDQATPTKAEETAKSEDKSTDNNAKEQKTEPEKPAEKGQDTPVQEAEVESPIGTRQTRKRKVSTTSLKDAQKTSSPTKTGDSETQSNVTNEKETTVKQAHEEQKEKDSINAITEDGPSQVLTRKSRLRKVSNSSSKTEVEENPDKLQEREVGSKQMAESVVDSILEDDEAESVVTRLNRLRKVSTSNEGKATEEEPKPSPVKDSVVKEEPEVAAPEVDLNTPLPRKRGRPKKVKDSQVEQTKVEVPNEKEKEQKDVDSQQKGDETTDPPPPQTPKDKSPQLPTNTKDLMKQKGVTVSKDGRLMIPSQKLSLPTELCKVTQDEENKLKNRFECQVCKKVFYRKDKINYHIYNEHRDEFVRLSGSDVPKILKKSELPKQGKNSLAEKKPIRKKLMRKKLEAAKKVKEMVRQRLQRRRLSSLRSSASETKSSPEKEKETNSSPKKNADGNQCRLHQPVAKKAEQSSPPKKPAEPEPSVSKELETKEVAPEKTPDEAPVKKTVEKKSANPVKKPVEKKSSPSKKSNETKEPIQSKKPTEDKLPSLRKRNEAPEKQVEEDKTTPSKKPSSATSQQQKVEKEQVKPEPKSAEEKERAEEEFVRDENFARDFPELDKFCDDVDDVEELVSELIEARSKRRRLRRVERTPTEEEVAVMMRLKKLCKPPRSYSAKQSTGLKLTLNRQHRKKNYKLAISSDGGGIKATFVTDGKRRRASPAPVPLPENSAEKTDPEKPASQLPTKTIPEATATTDKGDLPEVTNQPKRRGRPRKNVQNEDVTNVAVDKPPKEEEKPAPPKPQAPSVPKDEEAEPEISAPVASKPVVEAVTEPAAPEEEDMPLKVAKRQSRSATVAVQGKTDENKVCEKSEPSKPAQTKRTLSPEPEKTSQQAEAPKKRGRPRKAPVLSDSSAATTSTEADVKVAEPKPEATTTTTTTTEEAKNETAVAKPRRGRPPKKARIQETEIEKPKETTTKEPAEEIANPPDPTPTTPEKAVLTPAATTTATAITTKTEDNIEVSPTTVKTTTAPIETSATKKEDSRPSRTRVKTPVNSEKEKTTTESISSDPTTESESNKTRLKSPEEKENSSFKHIKLVIKPPEAQESKPDDGYVVQNFRENPLKIKLKTRKKEKRKKDKKSGELKVKKLRLVLGPRPEDKKRSPERVDKSPIAPQPQAQSLVIRIKSPPQHSPKIDNCGNSYGMKSPPSQPSRNLEADKKNSISKTITQNASPSIFPPSSGSAFDNALLRVAHRHHAGSPDNSVSGVTRDSSSAFAKLSSSSSSATTTSGAALREKLAAGGGKREENDTKRAAEVGGIIAGEREKRRRTKLNLQQEGLLPAKKKNKNEKAEEARKEAATSINLRSPQASIEAALKIGPGHDAGRSWLHGHLPAAAPPLLSPFAAAAATAAAAAFNMVSPPPGPSDALQSSQVTFSPDSSPEHPGLSDVGNLGDLMKVIGDDDDDTTDGGGFGSMPGNTPSTATFNPTGPVQSSSQLDGSADAFSRGSSVVAESSPSPSVKPPLETMDTNPEEQAPSLKEDRTEMETGEKSSNAQRRPNKNVARVNVIQERMKQAQQAILKMKAKGKFALIRHVFSTYTKNRKILYVRYRTPKARLFELSEYLERREAGTLDGTDDELEKDDFAKRPAAVFHRSQSSDEPASTSESNSLKRQRSLSGEEEAAACQDAAKNTCNDDEPAEKLSRLDCPYCERTFSNPVRLHAHKQMHADSKKRLKKATESASSSPRVSTEDEMEGDPVINERISQLDGENDLDLPAMTSNGKAKVIVSTPYHTIGQHQGHSIVVTTVAGEGRQSLPGAGSLQPGFGTATSSNNSTHVVIYKKTPAGHSDGSASSKNSSPTASTSQMSLVSPFSGQQTSSGPSVCLVKSEPPRCSSRASSTVESSSASSPSSCLPMPSFAKELLASDNAHPMLIKQDPVLMPCSSNGRDAEQDLVLPDTFHMFNLDDYPLAEPNDSAISLDDLVNFAQPMNNASSTGVATDGSHVSFDTSLETSSFLSGPDALDIVSETTNGTCASASLPEIRSESGTPSLPDDGEFPCPQCDKRFGNRRNLTSHMRRHTGDYKIYCEDCGKGFFTQSKLDSHKRKHTGEKPFRCLLKTCMKRFRYKGDLAKHIRRYHPGHQQELVPIPLQADELLALQTSVKKNLSAVPGLSGSTSTSTPRSNKTATATATSLSVPNASATPLRTTTTFVPVASGQRGVDMFLPLLPKHPVKQSELFSSGFKGATTTTQQQQQVKSQMPAVQQQQQQQQSPLLPSMDESPILNEDNDPSLDESILDMLTQDDVPMLSAAPAAPPASTVTFANSIPTSAMARTPTVVAPHSTSAPILHDVLTKGSPVKYTTCGIEDSKVIVNNAPSSRPFVVPVAAVSKPRACGGLYQLSGGNNPSSQISIQKPATPVATITTNKGMRFSLPTQPISIQAFKQSYVQEPAGPARGQQVPTKIIKRVVSLDNNAAASIAANPVVVTAVPASGVGGEAGVNQTMTVTLNQFLQGAQPVPMQAVVTQQPRQQQQQKQSAVNTMTTSTVVPSRTTTTMATLAPSSSASRSAKAFRCEHPGCNRSFEKGALLKRHQKLHSGNCKFVCDVCQKCFESQSKIDDHYRKHTGEKPFACHVCGNKFRYKGDRTKHLKNLHGISKPPPPSASSSPSPAPASTTTASLTSTDPSQREIKREVGEADPTLNNSNNNNNNNNSGSNNGLEQQQQETVSINLDEVIQFAQNNPVSSVAGEPSMLM